ncbi:copper resistance protein NlpE N-terminal domain-containing protein [Deminuibacter soli]|uniref:NlpE C-terminal OB domain-containing protein n=1 Tax=Deminuibacter soli TaxID=2291815 RepID=A0A3E1NQP3_9BACT|nr:copper resistance protein NlpE N-terminal domain-containing protein [Deminuibacter soli]RFM30245.1 hypothetical protein DXN05_04555 [Deminuibacter soli]
MKKIMLLLTAAAFAATSCQQAGKNTSIVNADSVRHSMNMSPFSAGSFAGYFADTIPCADCAGIVMRLSLKSDSTFIMEQEYVGARDTSHRLFYQLGNYTIVDSTLRLSETTEGPHQFKITGPGELSILDNEGAIINNTRLKYTIHRQSVVFAPKGSILVHGMYRYMADAAVLHVCSMDKDFPVGASAVSKQMQEAYGKLRKAGNEPVFAELEGSFEQGPSGEEGKTAELFVVKKFIRFTPGEKCRE